MQTILWGTTCQHVDASRTAHRIATTLAEIHARQVRDLLSFAGGRRPKGDQAVTWSLIEQAFPSGVPEPGEEWLAGLPFRNFLREVFMSLMYEIFFTGTNSALFNMAPSTIFAISMAFGEEDYFKAVTGPNAHMISELKARKCQRLMEQEGLSQEEAEADDRTTVAVGLGEFDIPPETWIDTVGRLVSDWCQSQGSSESCQIAASHLMKVIPEWLQGLVLTSPLAGGRAGLSRFKCNLSAIVGKIRAILKVK